MKWKAPRKQNKAHKINTQNAENWWNEAIVKQKNHFMARNTCNFLSIRIELKPSGHIESEREWQSHGENQLSHEQSRHFMTHMW